MTVRPEKHPWVPLSRRRPETWFPCEHPERELDADAHWDIDCPDCRRTARILVSSGIEPPPQPDADHLDMSLADWITAWDTLPSRLKECRP